MNYVEQLAEIKKEKDILLKDINEKEKHILDNHKKETENSFYCLTSKNINIFLQNKRTNIEPCGTNITFEFITFPKDNASKLYSIEYCIQLSFSKDKKLQIEHNCSATSKHVNNSGIFFINNYNDLNTLESNKLILDINKYYDKKQDNDWVNPTLNIKNLISYFKKSSHEYTIENFIEEISSNIKPIIEKDISNIVISIQRSLGKTIDEFYSLKDYEKEKITKEIQTNLSKKVLAFINKGQKNTYYHSADSSTEIRQNYTIRRKV